MLDSRRYFNWKGSVVAAGSVVLAGNYPDNALLAGVPAKILKFILRFSSDGKNIHRSRIIYFGMINTTNYAIMWVKIFMLLLDH